MRILVIEPDLVSASLANQFFVAAGIECVFALNGQSAIHHLDAGTFDCIVLEPAMPGHNGIEFLHELRSYAEWRNLPAIIYTVLSAHDLSIDGRLKQQFNIASICYKPQTSFANLLPIIRSAVAATVPV